MGIKTFNAPLLTDTQKEMYSSEKLMNFRFLSRLLATTSRHVLTDQDLVEPSIQVQLSYYGQLAELVYSPIPIELLFPILDKLVQPGFPLEGYDFKGRGSGAPQLVHAFKGAVGALQVVTVFRASSPEEEALEGNVAGGQLVLAIAGSSAAIHALYDMAAIKHAHPCGRGRVHLGFWRLYQGIVAEAVRALEKGFEKHSRIGNVVLTGHSMGGVLAYLLMLDIITGQLANTLIPDGVKLTIASFGAPRAGDEALVQYWRSQVEVFRNKHGETMFEELAVKAYNDGVPALPPRRLGWRHFTSSALYLKHGRLFRTPPSESEKSAFHCMADSDAAGPTLYPKGGHNYYNNRDMERTLRRLHWLERAEVSKVGWEERYLNTRSGG